MKKGTKKIGKTKVFQQICPISLVCIRPLHFTCRSSILVPVVFTRDPPPPASREIYQATPQNNVGVHYGYT